MYKFITLSNGKTVQALYEADEDQVAKIAGSKFDFKELADGKIAQKIAFVDGDGNKIELFIVPFKSDLDTWHKTITDKTFAESIENLPAKFLPRVAEFNGSDDAIDLLSNILGNKVNTHSFKLIFNSVQDCCFVGPSGGSGTLMSIRITTNTTVWFRPEGGTTTLELKYLHTFNIGEVYTFSFIRDNQDLRLFINGIDVTSSSTIVATTNNNSDSRYIANRNLNDLYFDGKIIDFSMYNYAFTDQNAIDYYNGTVPDNALLTMITTGQGDYEYDLSGNANHGTWSGTGARFTYDLEGSIYANENGYSLWEHATLDSIQVPFDINGNALSLTPGTDIPTGYTKTRDVVAGGINWNMADSLVDFESEATILQNDTPGVAYVENTDAYGLVFDGIVNKKDTSHYVIMFIASGTGLPGAHNNYNITFKTDESIQFRIGVSQLFITQINYINNETDYRVLIWRNSTVDQYVAGAIGTFAVYIQGKNKSITESAYSIPNLDEMELVDVTGGSGTNPITNNIHTTSAFFTVDINSGDQISKININSRPVSPYEFTVSTGAYSIIDNPANEIFNRLNATRQTAASRAADNYDATHPYRYQINEIADPRIYDTYFEAAYKDRVFGRVVLDGTDLIRYDEELNYATQKAGADLLTIEEYCRIESIYP